MSLELQLQKFPKNISLKDGSAVTLRPLQESDEQAFHVFFLAVTDQERLFIKHRVMDLAVIRGGCQNMDLGRILPVLALAGNKIVADATLHQQFGGWKRHVGRVSVL